MWFCARIDNNRREYWEERCAKDGVHACVLRIFFSLFAQLCKFEIFKWCQKQNTIKRPTGHFVFVFFLFLFLCENRQQPTWILSKKVAKDGVHACVLRIFFLFLCTTVQISYMLSFLLKQNKVVYCDRDVGLIPLFLFFCLFFVVVRE